MRFRIKDHGRGSGSRIEDRGSGSRIRIKDQDQDDCQEKKIANLPSSPFTDEWCDVGTNTFWWAISAFLRALTLPLSSMCTRIVSFQPNHCYINVGIISISYKLHKLDDSLFLGWSTDSLRLTSPLRGAPWEEKICVYLEIAKTAKGPKEQKVEKSKRRKTYSKTS